MAMVAGALALLCGMAQAIPAQVGQMALLQSVEVDSGFTVVAAADVEAALAGVVAGFTGVPVTAAVQLDAAGHRRLQAGTTLTIQYAITCGNNCDAISASLANIASDPAAGMAHAAAIISAINTAAAAQGFNNVVLSTPADVMATIQAPTAVTITLPPVPAPPSPPAVVPCKSSPVPP